MNHLADETSPYLRQHADNPVEWYPWGEAALDRAQEEDKPIFLSIGYASCHWCHVMAHESFEDPATAADLAKWFVSVKVDREERPDLDAVYMAATQALTGSGGWPMSVFCTPDGRPFYAGTYFPPEERHGMPSFRRVVEALGEAWVNERAQVLAAGGRAGRRRAQGDATGRVLGRGGVAGRSCSVLGAGDAARSRATARRRRRGAGRGIRPAVGRLRPGAQVPPPDAGRALPPPLAPQGPGRRRGRADGVRTLDAMAAGGIYDHLVGGFCRYSTDARWLVPHFEKMLTDQALLARAYLHAWQVTGKADYLGVVNETLDFVLRDLSTPEGALYSSFDADAGGVEGAHATFTLDELVGDAAPAPGRPGGRVVRDHAERETGKAAPSRCARSAHPWPGRPRSKRPGPSWPRHGCSAVQPARDEKVLTEWNAMAVATLAEVAAATGNARYGQRAEEIGEFLWSSMYAGPRLMRSWQGGRARHLAVAADHAWLAEASLRLSEWTGKALWRERARRRRTNCSTCSGTRSPADSSLPGATPRPLVVRPKEFLDGALPSTNSVAVSALLRVNALVDDARLDAAVERTIALARPLLERHPGALPDLVAALPLWTRRHEIVITGERPDLLAEVRRRWLPSAVLAWGEPDDGPLFLGRPAEPGQAFVCQARSCLHAGR